MACHRNETFQTEDCEILASCLPLWTLSGRQEAALGPREAAQWVRLNWTDLDNWKINNPKWGSWMGVEKQVARIQSCKSPCLGLLSKDSCHQDVGIFYCLPLQTIKETREGLFWQSNRGGIGLIPWWATRSHMPYGVAKKKKKPKCTNSSYNSHLSPNSLDLNRCFLTHGQWQMQVKSWMVGWKGCGFRSLRCHLLAVQTLSKILNF